MNFFDQYMNFSDQYMNLSDQYMNFSDQYMKGLRVAWTVGRCFAITQNLGKEWITYLTFEGNCFFLRLIFHCCSFEKAGIACKTTDWTESTYLLPTRWPAGAAKHCSGLSVLVLFAIFPNPWLNRVKIALRLLLHFCYQLRWEPGSPAEEVDLMMI